MIDILSVVSSRHWLILPDALERMLAIASRDLDHEALTTRAGVPLNNTRSVSKRPNGTAVVPVTGPIFRRANLFTSISGATSTQVLATDIQAALDDPQVRAIVLEIDSPGGEANGINELAQMIYDARGKKPITAYIGGTGASAAYWIASAADSIVADATAVIGSIGVVSTVEDTTERDAKTGKRTYQIVSSNAPNKRPDVSTEAGRAQFQAVVDDLEKTFIASIARNRGISVSKVTNDFGQGGVMVGQGAKSAGMIDRLGSLESVIASSSSSYGDASSRSTVTSSAARAPIELTGAERAIALARVAFAKEEREREERSTSWKQSAARVTCEVAAVPPRWSHAVARATGQQRA